MIEWGGGGGGESASSCIQAEELPPLPSRSDPSPRVSHSSDQLPVASPSQTPQRVPAQAEGARPRPQCPMPTEGLQDCRPGDSEGCVTQAGRASLRPRAECSCCAACASLGRRVGPSRHPTQRSRSLAPAHSEAKRMRHCAHPVLLNCSSAQLLRQHRPPLLVRSADFSCCSSARRGEHSPAFFSRRRWSHVGRGFAPPFRGVGRSERWPRPYQRAWSSLYHSRASPLGPSRHSATRAFGQLRGG